MTSWSPYTDESFDGFSSKDLTILYEDEHLIAVSKPPGLLTHVGWGKAEVVLTSLMRDLVKSDKVHTIHRLDRPTSGVILFAQTPDAARALRESFDQRVVRKGYIALVRGICPEQGYVDHAIPKERKSLERIEARSTFRRLAIKEDTTPREVSLVQLSPLTGRAHQLRRHMRHLNHPLIGDANYGRSSLNRGFRENYGLYRLALHAHRIEFPHPETPERWMCIDAPIAPDMEEALVKMNFTPQQWTEACAQPLSQWVDPLRDTPSIC
jgi:tRNA pseudouridine65 synthase